MQTERTYTSLHLFAGIGGAALGFQRPTVKRAGLEGRFRTLCGVDVDPGACEAFERLTGAPAARLDLFSREDYTAFHGKEPPEGWREALPADLLASAGGEHPDVVFLSPPCKGFSGLLPAKSAGSHRYQALNRLTVRGLWLTLEAFEAELPRLVLLENVPRITSRGKDLLRQLKGLLSSYGYVFHEGSHCCGELGGLGQRRKRYLLIARHPGRMPSFVYQPPKQRLKSIGEVLGPLPLPDAPELGPLHRLPRLKWRTWVRLALIPAGGDWRDLEKAAGKYAIEHVPRPGAYEVSPWDEPAKTISGAKGIGVSNGVTAVQDPRLGHAPRRGVFRVAPWEEPATAVVGSAAARGSNGVAAVQDPRVGAGGPKFNHAFRVTPFDEPAGAVAGGTSPSSGGTCIADPRLWDWANRPGLMGVLSWEEPAQPITASASPSGSNCPAAVADPRAAGWFPRAYQVSEWKKPAGTVTSGTTPSAGGIVVPDPRLGCAPRNGSYGVGSWEEPAAAVIGASDVHAGAAAVADPRIPADDERPDPPPLIIAPDGTWHRPLTTLELAVLQSFPVRLPDGSPFVLPGSSDSKWREWIGNAVPPDAAEAIARQVLRALIASEHDGFELSCSPIWVAPLTSGFGLRTSDEP
jgi:site-specific DNA-cytosine methylase